MNDQPPTLPPAKNGLSVASLVLGVISIVPCSIFAGIPAIITGHIALNRANKSPSEYGGKGLAKAGLILGYLSLALGLMILPAMVLPALAKGKARAQEAQCRNNLRQIGLAARMYAEENEQKWPSDLLSLSNYLQSPRLLVCNVDRKGKSVDDWSAVRSTNLSYNLLVAGEKIDRPNTPIIRCRVHGSVVRADGSVQSALRTGDGDVDER